MGLTVYILLCQQVKSDAIAGAGLKGLSGIKMKEEDDITVRRPAKKLTEAEKWEARQLIASGVLDVSEYPTFEDEEDFAGDGKLVQDVTVQIDKDPPKSSFACVCHLRNE